MTWADIIALAQDSAGETFGPTNWFKSYQLKLAAAQVQLEASKEILCLDDNTASIVVGVNTSMVDLPADFGEVKKVRLVSSLAYLMQRYGQPTITGSYPLGTPSQYFIVGKRLGLYPGSAAATTLDFLYDKIAPTYAFSLYESNTDSTAATFTVTPSSLVIVITGGAKAGTYTIDTTAAAYDTIVELVARINALAIGVNAVKCPECLDSRTCADLDVVASIDMWGKTINAFLDPELPAEMQRQILVNAMQEVMAAKDKEFNTVLALRAERKQLYKKFKADYRGSRMNERFATTRETPGTASNPNGSYIGTTWTPA